MFKLVSKYLLAFAIFFNGICNAKITLPNIFSDNMVIQRNSEVVIWGYANPEAKISLHADFTTEIYSATTGSDAKFYIKFPTPREGGPYKITLMGDGAETTLNNVMIGEVWLVSGQSNMEMSASWGIKNANEEISRANYPDIRFFTVPKLSDEHPQSSLYGQWKVCTPATMKEFSAVGYFFAQRLHQNLKNVPIGIINASWSGSPIEIWTPENVFAANPFFAKNFEPLSKYFPRAGSAYNGMINPLKYFDFKGSIWYQGETNANNPERYADLLTRMANAWRQNKGYDFPFYIVQIAGYTGKDDTTVRIKNEQLKAEKMISQSGIVITSDLDSTDDIHPKNKKPVGQRLADLISKRTYGMDMGLVESPEVSKIEYKNNSAILYIDFATGLHSLEKSSRLFELADNSGTFHQAVAKIRGNVITLSSPTVRNPTNVRYGWSNVAIPDVYNSANLPLSSFSTNNKINYKN